MCGPEDEGSFPALALLCQCICSQRYKNHKSFIILKRFCAENNHLFIVSKALMYLFQVGVGKRRQKGIFSSKLPTFLKKVPTASIIFCASDSGAK
jgi:hypothetical protein